MLTNRNRLLQQQQQQQQQQHLDLQRRLAKAERVRKLWVDFEQWLRQPRTDMERERDQLTHQTGRVTSAAVKASRRRIEETHFLKARDEWQRRLKAVELRESDWDPMNEVEMKAVEEALGVDDEEGYITDPSPSPPHQLFHPSVASSALVLLDLPANKSATSLINGSNSAIAQPTPVPVTAPPILASSRTSSTSSYECVRPEEFHSEDDELTPDSDYSSFSSTISSIISEEDEAVGPVTEYMFTQALESSGFTGLPLDTLNDQGPVLARTLPALKLTEKGSSGGPPLNPPKRPPDTKPAQHTVTKANHARAHNTPSPQTLTPSTSSALKSQASSKPTRVHYPLVAPSLSDLSDYEIENDSETEPKRLSPSLVAQFEAQFEARKLEIRMEKIREFHELACEADIELCVNIANGRRAKSLARQEESKLVDDHYHRTVELRQRMEKERKEQVRQEQKRLRDEFSRRNSSSTSLFGQGPARQGRVTVEPQESDTEPDDDMQHRIERMKQEQLALQAKYASYEPVEGHVARRRAGTVTSDNAPPAVRSPAAVNGRLEEVEHGTTPKPSGSAWSVKPTGSTNRGLANIVNQNAPPKRTPSLFDQTAEHMSAYDVDSVDREADNEDDDHEKENTGTWSYMASGPKKKAPPVPSAPSPWNISGPQRSPQKAINGKSRLGIVTSAWDDDNFVEESNHFDVGDSTDVTVKSDMEKELESPQEKTPVIPSAPVPNFPANKKQTKKQRQGNKKVVSATKSEKTEPTPALPTQKAQAQPTPVQSTSKTQSKSVPVNVPGKSKKGSLGGDGDDLSSTPRPSVLKRLQAQLANEEATNEQDDETPTTPRPGAAKKLMQGSNSWARGFTKGAPSALSNSSFDDDVADLVDFDISTTSLRTTLDQTNGKKNGVGAGHDAPQVPGSWKWGSGQTDKVHNQVDPPVVTTTARKNGGGRQVASSAAAERNGIEPDTGKKKGKKAVNGSGGQRSAWGKRTTVEEVPDDEGEDLLSGSQSESLPFNSRSILEARDAPEVEQPRILEPKPSKPRTMYESIFQYGENAPDHESVDDLREGLDWSEERLASALARMAQDSAEMERRVNGFGSVPTSNVGVSMNGVGPAKAMTMSASTGEQQSVSIPKKARWQPGTLGGQATASSPQTAFANANKMMSRTYDDDAFSPLATNNNGFSGGGFHFGSYGAGTNGMAGGWSPSHNPYPYPLTGNHSFSGAEEEDDELARTARSLLENIHVSVSSQQRNRAGFAAA